MYKWQHIYMPWLLYGLLALKVRRLTVAGRALLLSPTPLFPSHLLPLQVRVDDIYCEWRLCMHAPSSLSNSAPPAGTWVTRLSGHIRVNHYDPMLERMVLVKAVWAAWRIALPLLVWQGVSPAEYWLLFLVAELASGYWLAWNFQVCMGGKRGARVKLPGVMGGERGARVEHIRIGGEKRTRVEFMFPAPHPLPQRRCLCRSRTSLRG